MLLHGNAKSADEGWPFTRDRAWSTHGRPDNATRRGWVIELHRHPSLSCRKFVGRRTRSQVERAVVPSSSINGSFLTRSTVGAALTWRLPTRAQHFVPCNARPTQLFFFWRSNGPQTRMGRQGRSHNAHQVRAQFVCTHQLACGLRTSADAGRAKAAGAGVPAASVRTPRRHRLARPSGLASAHATCVCRRTRRTGKLA